MPLSVPCRVILISKGAFRKNSAAVTSFSPLAVSPLAVPAPARTGTPLLSHDAAWNCTARGQTQYNRHRSLLRTARLRLHVAWTVHMLIIAAPAHFPALKLTGVLCGVCAFKFAAVLTVTQLLVACARGVPIQLPKADSPSRELALSKLATIGPGCPLTSLQHEHMACRWQMRHTPLLLGSDFGRVIT